MDEIGYPFGWEHKLKEAHLRHRKPFKCGPTSLPREVLVDKAQRIIIVGDEHGRRLVAVSNPKGVN